MKEQEFICTTNEIGYGEIRGAMVNGSRTVSDLKESIGVCGECEGCKNGLEPILSTLCGCNEVPMETVINLVNDGVKTVEEIAEKTKATTGEDCGRCTDLVKNVIELGY